MKLLFVFLLFPAIVLLAQPKQSTALQTMVDTEHAFAKMAKDQNTRAAFLFYLSDSVITSGTDGPVKGKEHIEKQAVNSNWLHWYVAFADIAASGDLGYTTGPWEYYKTKTDTKALAYGDFNSVWKKQSDGSWKNILDIGIGHGAYPQPVAKYTLPATMALQAAYAEEEKTQATDLDKKFIESYKVNKTKAYQTFISPNARIDHEGHLPLTSVEEKQKYITEELPIISFEPLDGGTASSNDLGYVYGKATVTLLKDGKTTTKPGTYVRIWKRGQRGWKIVLDVLNY